MNFARRLPEGPRERALGQKVTTGILARSFSSAGPQTRYFGQIMISLRDFDFPEGESPTSPEDIVRDGDDPDDFSWWQPAFAVLAPPDAEK